MSILDDELAKVAQEGAETTTEKVAEQTTQTTETANTATTNTETTETKPDEVVNWFKENGFEGTTRDEFKPLFEKVKGYDTESQRAKALETQLAEKSQRETELSEKLSLLKDHANPKNFFGSDDEYRAALLKKAHPELDPISLIQSVTKDLPTDPREVLKLQYKLNNPEFTNAQIDAYLADKYGVDDFDTTTNFEDLETLSQTKIKIAEKEARKEFKTLKEGVTIPDVIDVDALISNKQTQTKEGLETLQKAWEPLVQTIPQQLDKVTITEGENVIFEYQIDEGFKKAITENIAATKQYLIDNGKVPNAENVQLAVHELKEYYMNLPENRLKIMNAYATQKVTQRELELKKEFNNPTLGNQGQANRTTSQQLTEQEEDAAVLASIRGN